VPRKKRPNEETLELQRRLLRKRLELDRKDIKKKLRAKESSPRLVKRKVRAKSAKELYDSKRKSFRGSKVENLSAGGVVKKVASSLINKYKPKITNQKEDYGLYSKQDYAGVIKNYQKTQKRKKRNRAGLVVGGAATAAAIQSKKDKENKK
tara:strand:+ start:370 stop:822 length:453 start_codon:yes stop_codon:yes gene_type:complete